MVIIATASMAFPLDKAVSTLTIAQRAKTVKPQLRYNQVIDHALLLRRSEREVARLRRRSHTNQKQDQALLIKELESKLKIIQDRSAAAEAAATAALELLKSSQIDSIKIMSSPCLKKPSTCPTPLTKEKELSPAQTLIRTEAKATCDRHGLFDCFLCALHAGDKEAKIQIKSLESNPIHTTSMDTSSKIISDDRCERHGLLGCFLCALVSEGISVEKFGIKPFEDVTSVSQVIPKSNCYESQNWSPTVPIINEQPQTEIKTELPYSATHLPPMAAMNGRRNEQSLHTRNMAKISAAYNYHKKIPHNSKRDISQASYSSRIGIKPAERGQRARTRRSTVPTPNNRSNQFYSN